MGSSIRCGATKGDGQVKILLFVILFTAKTWLITIAALLGIGILKSLATDRRRTSYDDDFGDPKHIIAKGNRGFVVDGVRSLSREDSFRNLLVTGNVGSGKSTSVVAPFLLWVDDATIIVNDPSGELLALSHVTLAKRGYGIRRLRFRTPNASSGYNVLARAQTSGQINKAAQVIVHATLKNQKDPFWTQLSITLLSCLIQLLQTKPKEYRTLANVRQLLQLMIAKPKAVDQLFANAPLDTYRTYASFIGYGEKIVAGVVASCAAALQIIGDTDIARVTSFDTIGDFSGLRKRKQAIFLQNNVVDTEYLSFVIDLYFAQLLEYLLSELPQPDDLPMYLVLDEFGSSMRIPNMAQSIATLRKTNTGILAICQDRSQLIHNYGVADADTIHSSFYSKLYLSGGLDLAAAQNLEKRSGKFEFEDEKGVRRVRELITASEVLQIESNMGLFDVGSHPLMKIPMTPYYDQFRFRGISPSPFVCPNEIPEVVPLLKL